MPTTNYSNLGVTVPKGSDSPPDVPGAFEDFADSFGAGQTAGKLLVVQSTGAAAWKAMSGDVAINASGVTQIGNSKIATGMYQDGSVTSQKVKPTVGVKTGTADLTCTAALQDIPGLSLSITPAVASILEVTLVISFSIGVAAALGLPLGQGTLKLDSSEAEAQMARFRVPQNTGDSGRSIATVSQVYLLSLSAAAHTIKAQALRDTKENDVVAQGENSRMLYRLWAA